MHEIKWKHYKQTSFINKPKRRTSRINLSKKHRQHSYKKEIDESHAISKESHDFTQRFKAQSTLQHITVYDDFDYYANMRR